jgi:uncharacterized protein (TIGR02001 family)
MAALLLILAPSAAHAGDWGGVFSALTYTSDYRYQGVSSTDLRPALQGYVHWQRADGLFAGVFASQVHYYDGGPRLEIDAYAGKHFELDGGRTELTAEALYSTFPNNPTPGPTFDFLELETIARHQAGALTLTGAATLIPEASYGAGVAWTVEGQADLALGHGLTLKGLVGRRWTHKGPDRTYFSAGAALGLGKARFGPRYIVELKYAGTNLDRTECGYNPRICAPAWVGALTVNLPPIL